MVPYWFQSAMPPSRHTIENTLRLGLWGAGLGGVYITCVQDQVPYKCDCFWEDTTFTLEWAPMDFFVIRLVEPPMDQSKLERFSFQVEALKRTFTHMLGHEPLAFYRSDSETVIEWRVHGLKQRAEEIQAGGVRDFEKLS